MAEIALKAVEETAQEGSWAHLSAVGTKMRQLNSACDPRTYSHRRLPGWTGLYKNRGVIRADSIYLSVYHFNLMSGCKREKTAMHELGHAHGFDHGPDNNVMYGVSKDICTLGSHDRQDYDDLWG